MSSNGLGSLTTSQINQINQLASNQGSEKDVLVAQFNGKEITFTAIRPRAGSDANQEKPVKGSDLAVQTLGLKDRKVSPALANKLIQAHKRTAPEDVIFVDMRDITFLREHVADSVKESRSSSNTLHSDSGSTTSLDSGYSSVYGSTESLNTDEDFPRDKTTSPLSEKVAELIDKENYRGAHIQMRNESLAAIKGQHITKAKTRWKRFPFSDEKTGYVPLPKKTALSIDEKHIPANKIQLTNTGYVAIQAPQAGNCRGDIWRAALDSGCSVICDLTGEKDKLGVGKGGPIDSYYPTGEISKVDKKIDREIVFDNGIKVKCQSKLQADGYAKIRYEVTDPLTGKTHLIRRYHYTDWPDHGVPNGTKGKDSLLKFIEALRTHQENKKEYSDNTMVHCLAGVGRTGTLIVLNEIYRDILSGKYQNRKELDQAVFKAIQQGRIDRGPAFVQSDDQIQFIMDTVHTWQDQRSRGENIIPRIK
ncbi:tyrosine-protein phosphatase [Endozoicomonas sp. SCSIO W0465]|uniref:tyrosine-protein phosphatase n=1 Tax=Endozoicomonas sp. SCSIO W0465 TaxID=2918516 RepID=UPI0020765410|nr:tyrosine-protein phosphatase [Endozoicomonas sp. SCSIO W0465]USE36083.1 tyrosine-protein phosphatase [Endozoicomonas sp. SCSIO W0465]